MKFEMIEGDIKWAIRRRNLDGHVIIQLGFFKSHRHIATVFWHPAAREYVLRTEEGALTGDTLKQCMKWMNTQRVRTARRLIESKMRREASQLESKEATNVDM